MSRAASQILATVIVALFAFIIPDARAQEFDLLWDEVQRHIAENDLGEAAVSLERLNAKKEELGYRSLEPISLWLISEGERRLWEGATTELSFFAHHARALTPGSAAVILRSLKLVHRGGGSVIDQLRYAIDAAVHDRVYLLELFTASIYPLLWAALIAILLAHLGALVYFFPLTIRPIARLFSPRMRPFVAIPLTVACLAAPIAGGPLWTLAAWSWWVILSIPARRGIAFVGAVILALWAICTPLRENLSVRLTHEAARAALRVTSGDVSPHDEALLIDQATRWESDPVTQYSLGQVLRVRGNLPAAEEALRRADGLWQAENSKHRRYAIAQLGVLALGQGNIDSAQKYFEEARSLGLSDAAFFVNLSRLHFERTETDLSRSYMEQAQKLDPDVARRAQALEDQFGMKDWRSYPEISLPVPVAMRSLLVPVDGVAEMADARIAAIGKGLDPIWLAAIAFILAVSSLLPRDPTRRVHREVPFAWRRDRVWAASFIRVLPGGAWFLGGRSSAGVGLVMLVLLPLFPLLGWPSDCASFIAYLPDIGPFLISGAALVAMLVTYAGLHIKHEDYVREDSWKAE